MLRFPTFVFLCLAATPALAQNQTAPAEAAPAGPPPEAIAAVQTAASAFGQCIQTGVTSVPASVTPEAGATNVLAGCATQRSTVEQAVQALIATLPAAQQAMAQEQLRTQTAGIQGQVADAIRQARAPAPAAPATTPAQ